MYLRKVDGPRSVCLPDGTVMTRADLPPSDTVRWVASRKAAVVHGVRHGLMKRDEALEMYGVSEEEFETWDQAISTHGLSGLKATIRNKS